MAVITFDAGEPTGVVDHRDEARRALGIAGIAEPRARHARSVDAPRALETEHPRFRVARLAVGHEVGRGTAVAGLGEGAHQIRGAPVVRAELAFGRVPRAAALEALHRRVVRGPAALEPRETSVAFAQRSGRDLALEELVAVRVVVERRQTPLRGRGRVAEHVRLAEDGPDDLDAVIEPVQEHRPEEAGSARPHPLAVRARHRTRLRQDRFGNLHSGSRVRPGVHRDGARVETRVPLLEPRVERARVDGCVLLRFEHVDGCVAAEREGSPREREEHEADDVSMPRVAPSTRDHAHARKRTTIPETQLAVHVHSSHEAATTDHDSKRWSVARRSWLYRGVPLRPDRRLRLVSSPPSPREAPTPASDASLVLRARGGDREAETELFLRHTPRLVRVVDRMLGDRDETDDVVQDTLETALGKLGSLRGPEAFGGWLLSIAVRHVHRRLRRRRLALAFGFLTSAEGVEPLEEQVAPFATAEQRAELALLDRALARLAPAERIAWTLRWIEGLELSEIATALDCSVTTVKRRLQAADAEVRLHVAREETHDRTAREASDAEAAREGGAS